MEVIRGFQKLTEPLTNAVVTIGNFDGVHLGHQDIIKKAIAKARARNGTSVAYTFRPHPQVVLHPEADLELLSTYDEKLERIGALGVDYVIEEPFSREFSEVEPREFFNDVLLHGLSAQEIVIGYDFAFGRERHGHLSALEAFCKSAHIFLTVVPPFRADGEVVSSSLIRRYLKSGDVENANRLLGQPFFYRGMVAKGDGRGRQLGFPTANLRIENKLSLPHGVYATWAMLPGSSERIPSVTNIGVRPTFQVESTAFLPAFVEVHLIGTTRDLYGTMLEVRFMKRLREERRFSGVEELKKQIAKDIQTARESLTKSIV